MSIANVINAQTLLAEIAAEPAGSPRLPGLLRSFAAITGKVAKEWYLSRGLRRELAGFAAFTDPAVLVANASAVRTRLAQAAEESGRAQGLLVGAVGGLVVGALASTRRRVSGAPRT